MPQTYIDINNVCNGCGEAFVRTVNRKQALFVKYCSTACQRRAMHLRQTYGITFEEVNILLLKQENKCAICKIDLNTLPPREINIDHCHKTGKVRGILCSQCNTGIGSLKDDIILLKASINYLEENDK